VYPQSITSSLCIDPSNAIILYVATEDGVYKSSDGGASWIAANAGLPKNVATLAIDPIDPATLYAGTFGAVFKTKDAGTSWSAVSQGLPADRGIYTLAIDPAGTIYAGTIGAGVFKSADGGVDWEPTGDAPVVAAGQSTSARRRNLSDLATLRPHAGAVRQ
jgi:photosystem II stability/assembly factor-like uncharacterized protein